MKRANISLFLETLRKKRLFVFSPEDVVNLFGWSRTSVRFLLHRYTKKQVITRLRRGLYMLADVPVSEFFVANRLFEPSYISLETALSIHRIIPETVYAITSVTTRTTRRFSVLEREFYYHRVKPKAFTGYRPMRLDGHTVLVADPEKAIVDYYYLVSRGRRKPLDLERAKLSGLKFTEIDRYARLFQNKTLRKHLVQVFSKMSHL